jgi:signal transduction histidine kinase
VTGVGKVVAVDERNGRRMIILAALVTVGAFLGASCAALARLQQIRHDSRAIVTTALPSIRTLSEADRSLGRVAVLISQLDGAPLGPETLREIRHAIGRLELHADAYVALPAAPGERQDWWMVRECISELGAVFDAIDASNPKNPATEVQLRLASAVDRADAVLLASIERNATTIHGFVGHIESTRASALRRALVFNGVGVVLAALLLVMVLRSLRRQVAAERCAQSLLEARAAELEAFAARVAHDLVSPLTPTVLWLERLRESPDIATRNTAEKALRGVGRVTELVDALFAFARAPRGEQLVASSDLEQVAREVVAGFEELAATSHVSLELVSSGPMPSDVHAGIVASILGNLLQNAIRYLGNAQVRRVTVRLTQKSGRTRVEVIDTGPGVPPELQERIFDPYFRAAGRDQSLGLGLGLATARRLVEAHGGSIGVSSAGTGSIFWFELPAPSRA